MAMRSLVLDDIGCHSVSSDLFGGEGPLLVHLNISLLNDLSNAHDLRCLADQLIEVESAGSLKKVPVEADDHFAVTT